MQKSSIEWTNYTSNPVRARHKVTNQVGWGCVLNSPGCVNCFSAVLNNRFGTREPYTVGGSANVDLFLDYAQLEKIAKSRHQGKLFLEDMSDLFWDRIPDEWLDEVFAVVAMCSNFTFQVLTKRADRLPAYFVPEAAERWARIINDRWMPKISPCLGHLVSDLEDGVRWPLPNFWLGVSAENQEWAEKRIPYLLETPAAVRFISAEPLIGPIDLETLHAYGYAWNALTGEKWSAAVARGGRGLDWVIAGGESGSSQDIRGCDLEWIRSIVGQCKAAEVPVFVKQLGRLPVIERTVFDPPKPAKNGVVTQEIKCLKLKDSKGGNPAEWPDDLRIREMPAVAEATR